MQENKSALWNVGRQFGKVVHPKLADGCLSSPLANLWEGCWREKGARERRVLEKEGDQSPRKDRVKPQPQGNLPHEVTVPGDLMMSQSGMKRGMGILRPGKTSQGV